MSEFYFAAFLPMPPTANTMYETTVNRYYDKKGKLRFKTGKMKSDDLEKFQQDCTVFKLQNQERVKTIEMIMVGLIEQGYIFRLDSFFSFKKDRVLCKKGNPKRLDADNRRKALQDGVSKIFGIDDKYFFSGNAEKIICDKNEQQGTIIRITATKVRTHDEVMTMIQKKGFSF